MENLNILLLSIVFILILTFIIFTLISAAKEKKKEVYVHGKYQKHMILTKTEQTFFDVLYSKCKEKEILIFPKVRLEDFIKVVATENYNGYRNRIKSRHIDFLLCDRNLNIIAAIELDDPSHNTEQAAMVDKFKNNLYNTVGIRLYRIKTDEYYPDRIDEILNSSKIIA